MSGQVRAVHMITRVMDIMRMDPLLKIINFQLTKLHGDRTI